MKILVIALAGIGDTLLATPLLHELRLNYPDAQIDALVLWKGAKQILDTCPDVSTVHQRNLLAESKLDSLAFLRSLGETKYDISINTHPQSRIHYRLIAKTIGARQRLSHRYDRWTALDALLVNRVLDQDYARHTVDQNLDFLGVLGRKPLAEQHRLGIWPTPADHDWAEAFLGGNGLKQSPLLGIHTGSGGTKNLALKRWPEAHYRELLKRLKSELGFLRVALFGGPEEWESLERLKEASGHKDAHVVRAESLRQTAALIARCDSFLSVDTALMHVAAAVQVPRQIVIEAPTFNKTNEPYQNRFTLVPNPAVAGRNLEFYRYDGRGIQGTEEELRRCMASISVESVLEALRRQIPRPETARAR